MATTYGARLYSLLPTTYGVEGQHLWGLVGLTTPNHTCGTEMGFIDETLNFEPVFRGFVK